MKDYKKILEGVVGIIRATENSDIGFINICDYISGHCPELEENMDERIRKEILKELKEQQDNIPYPPAPNEMARYGLLQRWMDWLKQGEQKPATDKVEPMFNIGDFIVNDYCMGRVVEITNDAYLLDTEQGIPFSCNSTRLWDIAKDANDGDVLQLGNVTAIFKEFISNNDCKCYCSVCNGEFEIPSQDGGDNIYGCHNAIPATKEQRGFLFKRMHEAGYEWDAKELKKIVIPIFHIGDRVRYKGHECDGVITEITDTDYICRYAKLPISTQDELELVEQKSSLSEEDEIILNGCIQAFEKLSEEVNDEDPQVAKELRFCYRKNINWLKSLKERYLEAE